VKEAIAEMEKGKCCQMTQQGIEEEEDDLFTISK
jgi:hypothetical protein